jgi:hypothetical protein
VRVLHEKCLTILRDRYPPATIIICSIYSAISLLAAIPKYLIEDVIATQISFTFEFSNVQHIVGPKQLNSVDAFCSLAAKATDIVIQSGE